MSCPSCDAVLPRVKDLPTWTRGVAGVLLHWCRVPAAANDAGFRVVDQPAGDDNMVK